MNHNRPALPGSLADSKSFAFLFSSSRTIVDPSDPKAQMAGPSLPDRDDEPLPSYSPLPSNAGDSPVPASSSSAPTEPLLPTAGSHWSQEEEEQVARIRSGMVFTRGPISAEMCTHMEAVVAAAGAAPAASTSTSTGPVMFGSSWRASLGEFEPEPLSSLNPESAKKLALEAQMAGHSAEDYNFTIPALPSLPPPSFGSAETTDRPQYSLDSHGNITSHSSLLNSSPDALLRFLRLHASSPPSLAVHLRGTHLEKRHETRWETNKHGRRVQRMESRDEEVEDFQFWIDGSHVVEVGLGRAAGGGSMRGLIYAALPHECLRRGGAWSQRGLKPEERDEGQIRLDEEDEVSLQEQGKCALKHAKWKTPGLRERRRLAKEHLERDRRGLPGFVLPEQLVNALQDERPLERQLAHPALLLEGHFLDVVENHAATAFGMTPLAATLPARYAALVREREERDGEVKEVAEAYCASRSVLKELKVEKEAYGWNWRLLEQGIRATIRAAGYQGTVQVSFNLKPQTIVIRPDNAIMKVFSLPVWAKVLLWLVLV